MELMGDCDGRGRWRNICGSSVEDGEPADQSDRCGMTYVVHVIHTTAALAALKKDWHALEAASRNSVPFRTFEWVDCWWRHFAESKFVRRDLLETRFVRALDGTPVLAAPMMVTERPSRGPVRMRSLRFFGTDPNITEIRSLLIDPAHEAEAHRALIEDLARQSEPVHWVEWSGVVRGSVAEADLDRGGRMEWGRDIPDFILPLASDWDSFRKGLRRNVRESLRKCYNSLRRDGLTFDFEVVSHPDEIGPALDEFFRLHTKRSKVTGTVHHPDVFPSAATRAFLTEVTTLLAHRNVTRIFRLRVNGEVVATRVGFVMHDSMYLYYSGYDPAWARYSVATTVLAEALKWAIANGLLEANLATGDDVSKSRWGPREVRYREGVQVDSNLPGRLAWSGWRLAQRAHRTKLTRSDLTDRARRHDR
jgi:CelD/BcsL family acetyltransferase involved in cellulose biosynthesis